MLLSRHGRSMATTMIIGHLSIAKHAHHARESKQTGTKTMMIGDVWLVFDMSSLLTYLLGATT